ncbi:conserved hypothetical protein [Verticillium alfalfae VaMs.102]|uniref:MHD domain-containing protein n=1 Tax=Verticillium alfalfae (strain VaMs.102 / ATCC MYA-4576 / FGSC 10136) TaxID=526221 RepID=C9S660_VERA1|nr:conserved hypothetical protein [Verticillium alfalfae VaMs.102]EEY15122.1 conserved hypothetical protein [Verticillium alfalfae VaMs.102]
MDDTARTEYPSMLGSLQPTQAVHVLTERVKRINKINGEIAEWLQERRKVEEQYVLSLRKLLQFKVPNAQSELGVFQAPWDKILQAVDATAQSHHQLAANIDRDVEAPLRAFGTKPEMQDMIATSGNLASMARDLDEAQKKVETLGKKGTKGNAQKLEAALSKLNSSTQQWDSSAPFIFESLQALDEQRVNQLRDLLTQYQTHESDQAQRSQATAAETLASMLEISTELEIASFQERATAGRPRLEKRPSTRQTSHTAGGHSQSQSLAPPNHSQMADDTTSERSVPVEHRPPPPPEPRQETKQDGKTESKLRSRIGTMLGRRRQSVHSGFGSLSPGKSGSFGRTGSSHGRPGLSPRTSSSNLGEANNRLSMLPESPSAPSSQPNPPQTIRESDEQSPHEGTNGVAETTGQAALSRTSSAAVNGADTVDVSDVPPPPGPPPSQLRETENKDAEGFTVPPPATDPISQAQREAAEDNEQMFKLNIQSSPIQEEDPEESQAAITNVASTLGKMSAPTRKMGTVRGRRDVRNTIYVPAPPGRDLTNENPFPSSPPLVSQTSRPSAVATLASEASIAATSDTQSIRSANSLSSLAHQKHPEMTGPGLNSSIIETVTASFEDGVVKSAKISGEIAFSYHGDSDAPESESIRINNFPNLEVIGPNRIFVHNVSPEQPDQFTLNLSHLNKTATAFTYRVHDIAGSDAPSLAEHAPLLLRPVKVSGPVTLHNVVFVVTYEGARASGAQTKPSGTHLKEKQLVYWRLPELTLTSEVHKIVCRIVGAENGEPKPGHVEARWEYTPAEGTALGSGISVSRLEESKGKGKDVAATEDDPFADEELNSPALPADQRWVDVPLARKVVSGRYEAK